MATKKDAANTLVSGGVGFLFGCLLRPKPKVAGGLVTIENVVITPLYPYLEPVSVSCTATNTSSASVTVDIACQVNKTILIRHVTLPSNVPTEIVFEPYTPSDFGIFTVSVFVYGITTSFEVVSPD